MILFAEIRVPHIAHITSLHLHLKCCNVCIRFSLVIGAVGCFACYWFAAKEQKAEMLCFA